MPSPRLFLREKSKPYIAFLCGFWKRKTERQYFQNPFGRKSCGKIQVFYFRIKSMKATSK